jgi:hypothetical protein
MYIGSANILAIVNKTATHRFAGQARVGLLLVLLLGRAAVAELPARVAPVGAFTAIVQDKEHCQGYRVDLWQAGGVPLGLLHVCAGLTGDQITAVADVSQLDLRTGAVAFEANMSLGMDYLKGGTQAASRDHLSFKGKITGSELVGDLTWSNENHPKHRPRTETLHLRRLSEPLPGFSGESEWLRHAASLVTPPG